MQEQLTEVRRKIREGIRRERDAFRRLGATVAAGGEDAAPLHRELREARELVEGLVAAEVVLDID